MMTEPGIVKQSLDGQQINAQELVMKEMQDIASIWAELLIEECRRLGCDTLAIAPGSRSTALVLAAAQQSQMTIKTHIDERSLAFWALGYAKVTGKPVPLICTSGTAVANLLPAVIEASQSAIPMLILSADRPPEHLDTGANQSIQQNRIFGDYTRWFHTIPCPSPDIEPAYLLSTIDHAVYQATGQWPGPVHLNLMFREPLAPHGQQVNKEAYLAGLKRTKQFPYTRYGLGHRVLSERECGMVMDLLMSSTKGCVILGQGISDMDTKFILSLISALGWPVITDPGTSLHYRAMGHCEDTIFDTALLLGSQLTLKQHLSILKHAKTVIQCDPSPIRLDATHSVTHRFVMKVSHFCRPLSQRIKEMATRIDATASHLITSTALCQRNQEQDMLQAILEQLEEGTAVFLSNSGPIRHGEQVNIDKDFRIYVNRGASGIDGILSTAIGISEAYDGPTACIIGDVAMAYDMNALLMLKTHTKPLYICVLNNSGGGIFKQLPVAGQQDVLDPYFVMPQEISFQKMAEMAGLPYQTVSSVSAIKDSVKWGTGPMLLECIVE